MPGFIFNKGLSSNRMLPNQTLLPYRLEGNGYPLLLLHGLGVTHAIWQNLIPLLAPHFQLIMVELPGTGTLRDAEFTQPYYPTCAEALEELRIALGIEQWTILAYSTGTRVCETYLQLYPGRVARAVFLCPFYIRKPPYALMRSFIGINAKHVYIVNWLLTGWRLYGWLWLSGFNLQRNEYISDWMNEIKLLPVENLKRVITDLPNLGRAPFILPGTTQVPILYIWASSDAISEHPIHLRPNDVIIQGCHSAPLLNSQRVVEVALPFLQEEVERQERRSSCKHMTQNAGSGSPSHA
jgi:pimeloyl-ACP methyl ester carboxylesterase